MPATLPLSAGDVVTLIDGVAKRTRPSSQADLYQALNYGVGKAVRALSAIRPGLFESFVDPFVLRATTPEYALSTLNPPLLRPHRLIVSGNGGTNTVLFFVYRDQMSADYQQAETTVAGRASVLVYDIVDGLLPSPTTTTVPAGVATGQTSLAVGDGTLFTIGGLLQMPVGGTPVTPNGWAVAVPQPYAGYVVGIAGNTLTIEPPLGSAINAGTVVTPMRRRVLMIQPAVVQSYSGRLWYVYDPPRLARSSDLLPMGLARYVDMIVAYAIGFLKIGVDDAMEARWELRAQEMRAELMQDGEPAAGQQSQAVGSALDSVVGF